MNSSDLHTDKLKELCENHNVKTLYLFGLILTDKFDDTSDIDMLIQFSKIDPLDYFDNYKDLKEKLKDLYKRPIDLVEDQAIKNPIFRQIVDRDKKLVYERKSA